MIKTFITAILIGTALYWLFLFASWICQPVAEYFVGHSLHLVFIGIAAVVVTRGKSCK